jgi:Ni,Fe-hydrogenase maturation factor
MRQITFGLKLDSPIFRPFLTEQTTYRSTLGLQLLPYLRKASHIFFVDASDTGAQPGGIVQTTEAGNNLANATAMHRLGNRVVTGNQALRA